MKKLNRLGGGQKALPRIDRLKEERLMTEGRSRLVKVAALQPGPNSDDIVKNTAELLEKVDRIGAQEKPDFLLLGELSTLPYIGAVLDTKYFDWAEEIPGPTTEAFGGLAKKHEMCVLLGMFERAKYEGVFYNSLVVLGPDGRIVEGVFPDGKRTKRYVKSHIPYVIRDTSKYNEAFYFTPGFGWPVFDTPKAKIGLTICFDRHFPEPFRILALQGAELIFNPNVAMGFKAVAGGASMADTFLTELQARAVENSVWLCVVNKAGTEVLEGQETYCYGNSSIIDPTGKIVAQAPESEEALISSEIDLQQVADTRLMLPLFRARRPHLYKMITEED